ncbi:MAG TPA: transcriptional regulator Spx [Firmicutes bacterium]|nr:transcriptional regulator Spx [Bacillota bacterium]
MVEIYTTPSCSSCRKAKKWLEQYGIKYVEKNLLVTKITKDEIKHILEKTENGFDDIVSTRSKAFKDNNLDIEEMSMNDLLEFIIKYPSVLRRPIIVDKYRLQVGYNDEEIRTFLPREYRNVISCSNCESCNCSYLTALERALSDNFIESNRL